MARGSHSPCPNPMWLSHYPFVYEHATVNLFFSHPFALSLCGDNTKLTLKLTILLIPYQRNWFFSLAQCSKKTKIMGNLFVDHNQKTSLPFAGLHNYPLFNALFDFTGGCWPPWPCRTTSIYWGTRIHGIPQREKRLQGSKHLL